MKKKIWKKLSVIVLVLIVAVSLLTTAEVISGVGVVSAQAAEIVDSGTCGENLTWTLDSEGVLTISGEGEMYDSYSRSSLWSESDVRKVVFENGVTSIGGSAFSGCWSLTSIELPDSVTSIGLAAFSHCSSLTSIEIPNSVTSIGSEAFSGCTSLTSIVLPKSVTSIGSGAFSNCSNLTGMEIPNSVTSIGYEAFSNCTSLTSIEIPASVTSIGYEAFSEAFSGCSNLASIVVDPLNTVYDSRNNCNAIIETASNTLTNGCKKTVVPNSVTSIGNGAFRDCSNLTSIEIPNSVTSIGNYAFGHCESLTSIEIPNSVTSIGDSAFDSCSSLTSLSLPKSITSIGDGAFSGCDHLTIYYDGSICEFVNNISENNNISRKIVFKQFHKGFISDIITSATATKAGEVKFSCPDCGEYYALSFYKENGIASVDRISSLSKWLFSIVIPDSIDNAQVVSIGNRAFSGRSSLTSIEIPSSVTSIGEYAFFNCSSLTNIKLPDKIMSIDSATFWGCSSLMSIVIPSSVTSIGAGAFSNCSSMTSIEIPNSVTSIGYEAFSGCSSLTSIEIPNSVTSIGGNAFSGCSSLTSIEIPKSVTSIGSNAVGMYYSNVTQKYQPIQGFIIYGISGSTAEKYANENGITFVDNHDHSWASWKTTTTATVLKNGIQKRTCKLCKKVEKRSTPKLTPTIKLSATKKSVKVKKSFTLAVSKLAKGDSIKSVKSGKTSIATVKKAGTNKYKITGKKKGTAVITVKLKSGKKATCTVVVK